MNPISTTLQVIMLAVKKLKNDYFLSTLVLLKYD